MLKIAIVDDNESDIEDLEQKLEHISVSFDLYKFHNENLVLKELRNGKTFDIVFMDIQLKEKNGIEIVKEINAIDNNIDIIYCSAYINFTQDIFETGCIYFLLKPIKEEKLKAAMEKRFEKHKDSFITIKYNSGVSKIRMNNVAFIESELKWLKFTYIDGTEERYYLPFSAIEEKLPQNTFIRTHKSFIVNLEYMTKSGRAELVICGRWRIPISRTFLKSVRDGITLFLGGI